MRVPKKILAFAEGAALLAGVFIFWKILKAAGLSALAGISKTAGMSFFGVFLLYPFMSVWDVASWKNLFGESRRRARFFALFWIRLAGEAVNNITPGLDVGGEPLKVKWASERLGIPPAEGAASTILARTSILASEGLFVWAGLAAGWTLLPWPPGSRAAFAAAAAVVGAAIVSVYLFQRTKLFSGWSPGASAFYTRSTARFSGSVALNFAGWVSGVAEVWLFAVILGRPMGWRQALVFESLIQLVRTASFFVPGNIGTQEAGCVFLAQLMGFDASVGLALSLLKRARLLAWTAVGFGVWAVFQKDGKSSCGYNIVQ